MRTQALRVTIGAYEDREWHVTLIQDTYLRGVLQNSELLVGPIYCHRSEIYWIVAKQIDRLVEMEQARLEQAAAS